MPEDIGKAVRQARQASQQLVVSIALAVRSAAEAIPEPQWQDIVTATVESADAQAVVTQDAQRVQALIATAEVEVATLERALADMRTQGTNALFETGILHGRLVAARERLAGLSDLRTVGQRFDANRAAAAVLEKCHLAQIGMDEALEQTVGILADFTGAGPGANKPGTLTEIVNAWRIFWDPDNSDQRSVIIYILFGLLLFTTLTTIQSVPYYALGIELCPSYDGRTRVVTYRAVMDQIAGIIGPYVPVFCYLLYFHNALDGLFYVALFACLIGIPSTVLMVIFIKERMAVTISKRQLEHHAGIIMSFVSLCRNPNFLRIVFLYNFLGIVQGMFLGLGTYLNIYWVMGSAGAGARIGAYVGTFVWVLGLINLPVLKWACGKFQKHRVMSWAVCLMAFGTFLNFFCMVKGHPEYQFITPIFFSVGIASYYMVLSTMMADVTDHDELITGFRREGMFGAVNAFIIKVIATVSAVLPGVVLVLSGFDAMLEYNQTPETIFRMRIMNSFVPAALTLFCLVVLYKYPLTRERVEEIKQVLRKRRADRAALEAAEEAEAQPATP
jgi:GPH family glycoside/pentoside/hexuronide:cation symporter